MDFNEQNETEVGESERLHYRIIQNKSDTKKNEQHKAQFQRNLKQKQPHENLWPEVHSIGHTRNMNFKGN
jgi:hypothetical protein